MAKRKDATYSFWEEVPFLETVAGKQRGKVYQLPSDRVSIGRTPDNDIVLKSEAVSRIHAYITRRGASWTIRDNGSKNGVLVNGVRVGEKVLRPGDTVQLGNVVFKFNQPGAAANLALVSGRRAKLEWRERPSETKRETFLLVSYGALIVGLGMGAVGWYLLRATDRPAAKPTVPVPVAQAPKAEAKAETETETKAEAEGALVAPVAPEQVPKLDEKQELAIYLGEGIAFLQKGDFASAASAFQFALVIDPRNMTAMKGIKAAEYRKTDIAGIRLDRLPKGVQAQPEATVPRNTAAIAPARGERARVDDLFRKARASLAMKRYSESIESAEDIRKISISGESAYLNEAKQIIDKARMALKEEFEPFIDQAKEKFAAGDYQASRDLCEEMVKRDPRYRAAQECLTKAMQAIEQGSGGARP